MGSVYKSIARALREVCGLVLQGLGFITKILTRRDMDIALFSPSSLFADDEGCDSGTMFSLFSS